MSEEPVGTIMVQEFLQDALAKALKACSATFAPACTGLRGEVPAMNRLLREEFVALHARPLLQELRDDLQLILGPREGDALHTAE